MNFDELDDIECNQKMIDDLLRSIKTETKHLTTLQNTSMKGSRKKSFYNGSIDKSRIESLNISRKERFDTMPKGSSHKKISRLVVVRDKENEDYANASHSKKPMVSSPYDIYDREFVRGLVNRLSQDNCTLYQDNQDCIKAVKYLCSQYRALAKDHAALKLRNQALEKEKENTRLKSELRQKKEQGEKLRNKVKELLNGFLSFNDETEVLLHQESAENHKLRLMLQLQNGKDIPAEELAQLAVEEQKNMDMQRNKTRVGGTNDEDMLASILKAEGRMVEDPSGLPKGMEGLPLEGMNENEQSDMLAQFLRENEIVEGGPNEYEDQDEDMLVFRKGKRRDSF